MARPGILIGEANHFRPNGVEVDVTDQFQQIAVGIDEQRLVAALEQVAGSPVFAIDELGVAKSDILHNAGEGHVPHLDGQMDMVRHEAEGMDAIPETLNAFLDQQEKPRAVTVIEEDVLAAIAAKDDVINGAGIMKSRFAWHGRSVVENVRLSSLTLFAVPDPLCSANQEMPRHLLISMVAPFC